jgi:hypothetical protein
MSYKKLNELIDWTLNVIGKIIHIGNLPVKYEDDFASNSDEHVTTQKRIKKYVDDKVTSDNLADMRKATYDTDEDGIVDKAEVVDAYKAKIAEQE